MVELTERERHIICCTHFITHSAFSKVPAKVMGKALHATLSLCYGINMTGDELQDLVDGIKAEREAIMANALSKVNEFYPKI